MAVHRGLVLAVSDLAGRRAPPAWEPSARERDALLAQSLQMVHEYVIGDVGHTQRPATHRVFAPVEGPADDRKPGRRLPRTAPQVVARGLERCQRIVDAFSEVRPRPSELRGKIRIEGLGRIVLPRGIVRDLEVFSRLHIGHVHRRTRSNGGGAKAHRRQVDQNLRRLSTVFEDGPQTRW